MSYKKNGSLIKVVIVVLLILGLVGALGYLSKGFSDWKVSDWFKPKQEEEVIQDNISNNKVLSLTLSDPAEETTINELLFINLGWINDGSLDIDNEGDIYLLTFYPYTSYAPLFYVGTIKVIDGHFMDFNLLNIFNGDFSSSYCFSSDFGSFTNLYFIEVVLLGCGNGYVSN
jgi:hypothetical protein